MITTIIFGLFTLIFLALAITCATLDKIFILSISIICFFVYLFLFFGSLKKIFNSVESNKKTGDENLPEEVKIKAKIKLDLEKEEERLEREIEEDKEKIKEVKKRKEEVAEELKDEIEEVKKSQKSKSKNNNVQEQEIVE